MVLSYEFNRSLNTLLSYSQFYPGAFIDDTGRAGPSNLWTQR